jgi:Metallo-peptidase family M12
MHSPKRVSQVLLVGVALLAAALAYFEVQPTGGEGAIAPAVRSSSTPVENQGRTDTTNGAPLAGQLPASFVVAAEGRPNPALPAAISQLLPSVQTPVTNWKEFKPEKITIAPYPDMPIEFQMTSVREEHGRTVWIGRNPAIEGAFLVAAATEDDWHATLVIPPVGGFEAHIAGSHVTMLEKDLVNNLCGTQPAMGRQVAAPLVTPAEEIPAVAAAAETTANAVDVLFFYDADVLANVQGNTSTLETHLISYVAASNVALENSQVTNFHWRYLGAYQAPAYTATEDMANDLNVLTGVTAGARGGYVSAPNAVSSFAQQKAELHGADQVVLYVGSNPRRNFAGIAWISSSNLAFHSAVVAWPNNPGSSSSFLTVAHEMAHNFGCYHDRTTENATDGDGLFHYGFRYNRAGRDTGTIMSYASQAVPYYSNPSVTFEGVALGVPEGQPKAANNARVLRESAQVMIDSRPAVDPPTIATQPQSVTVTSGQGFTLSVTATGSNLAYQWKLAGVNIAGATGSSYSKTGTTSSDGGAYTVVVSNIAGQVTSNSATVTINAATSGGDGGTASSGSTSPTTTAASAPSSSGGGGGAMDVWFTGLCGFFVIARWILRRR